MLVQFGNNWIQKIPRTAKLDEAVTNCDTTEKQLHYNLIKIKN